MSHDFCELSSNQITFMSNIYKHLNNNAHFFMGYFQRSIFVERSYVQLKEFLYN